MSRQSEYEKRVEVEVLLVDLVLPYDRLLSLSGERLCYCREGAS